MSKSVFITRKISEEGILLLKEKGYSVDIYPNNRPPTQRELIKYLKKNPYDALLCFLTDVIDSKVLDAVSSLKIISLYTVSYNSIDVEEVKKRGISITNTAGVSRTCIAEHAVSLMLGLTTRLVEADDYVRKGKYEGWKPLIFVGSDLKGKTVGIVGAGLIGREVAHIVRHGFGAKVIYHDIEQNILIENECDAKRCDSLENLLMQADIVSLHVPLIDTTRHLINEERLHLMKKTALLINTSRGAVIDEQALVKALKDGIIRGAGLDVYEHEPKLTKGLSKLPNVILTPHIGSAREEVRKQMSLVSAQNIINFFE